MLVFRKNPLGALEFLGSADVPPTPTHRRFSWPHTRPDGAKNCGQTFAVGDIRIIAAMPDCNLPILVISSGTTPEGLPGFVAGLSIAETANVGSFK